jgi:hypothetical protein
MDGVRLAGLPSDPTGGEGFRAVHAFEALRDANSTPPAKKSGKVKRSTDTTSVSRAAGAALVPVRFSYFWRFS